jgi:hypothetical protein
MHIPRHSGAAKQFVVSIGSLDDPELTVHAQYRPKELEVTHPVPWAEHPQVKGALLLEFSGTSSKETSLELFLDESEVPTVWTDRSGEPAKQPISVLEQRIKMLTQLATVRSSDPKETRHEMRRPHHCVLVFGEVYGTAPLQCVITSMATKYVMFSPNGKPIRATVTLKLKEARFDGRDVDRWAGGRGDRDAEARRQELAIQSARDRALEEESDRAKARERVRLEDNESDRQERAAVAKARDDEHLRKTGESREDRRAREARLAYQDEKLREDLE